MDRHPLLEARALALRRGDVWVFQGISAAFGAGELVGLAGGSGSGVSELLDVLSGAVVPSDGEVFVFGARLTGAPQRRYEQHGVRALRAGAASMDFAGDLRVPCDAGAVPTDGAAATAQLRVLLLEGPLASNGGGSATDVAQRVRRLRAQRDVTVIWAEPSAQALMPHVDRLIVMRDGKKLADGTPAEVSRAWPGDERAALRAQ